MNAEYINEVLNRVLINRHAKKIGLSRTSGEVKIGLLNCQKVITRDPKARRQLERQIRRERNLDKAAEKAGISIDFPHLQ